MPGSPAELIKKLRHLPVTVDGEASSHEVAITHYASGNPDCDRRHAERTAFGQRLASVARHDRLGMTPGDIARVSIGVGALEHIGKCLRLAERHHLYSHDGSPPSTPPPTNVQRRLQWLADHWFGLDCVGFVCCWLRLNGIPVARPDALTPLRFATLGACTLRTTLAQVQPHDVVCWGNNRHVALVEHCHPATGTTSMPLVLAESAQTPIAISTKTLRMAVRPHHWHRQVTPFELVGRSVVPVFVGRILHVV